MKLVVVESPTKARTIGKFLGNGFEIRASMGHIMDLPKSKLGVDVEHDFAPQYEVSLDKKKTIAELKKLAKTADGIILATDPDREGEAISAHIQEVLSSGKQDGEKFSRIAFHEITKEAIEDALTHPGQVNTHLVDAQTARRVLDRLVGYKLSPLLWQKVRRGLSAGRVQSVALRLIVEREREIEKFGKEEYYTILVQLAQKGKKSSTDFNLVEVDNAKIEVQQNFALYDGKYTTTKTNIASQQNADDLLKDLQTKTFTVADIVKKQTKRSPQPPFTTSTLQQQASQRFGYSGKRTMSLAQKLYEEGYITYHRTDSVNLSQGSISSMRAYVEQTYGKEYIPQTPRLYSAKQKLAQEAHEAIRPTKVTTSEEMVSASLGKDYGKLYELIWRRSVASQMSDALLESTSVTVTARGGNSTHIYLFKTNGSVLVFEGFLKINPFGLEDKKVPSFTALDPLDLLKAIAEKHETVPPPRYNDASLIKSLEEAGIGRPSTYATIISTIETRQYIEREQKRFVPTTVGMAVTDFLVKNFSDIDDIPFTADMENKFDAVAQGEGKWQTLIKEFYTPFSEKLKTVAKADRVEIPAEETGEMCPKDGAPLVVRVGKFGKFISCKNFPTCDFKKQYVEETPYLCPKDNGKIIVKKTKKGRPFYGCSNYPKCDFAVWKIEDIKKQQEEKTKTGES
ncbi:MAG TPA: type I DNA topoisomerase [Candidatus Saccharimonadales bacterium]|nr:type I DNA topoisomerase [Candidatus Saccharimonadales bacterium]